MSQGLRHRNLSGEGRHHDVFGERIRRDDHVRFMIVCLGRKGGLKADAGDPDNLDWPRFVQVAKPRRAGGRGRQLKPGGAIEQQDCTALGSVRDIL